jgi:hypothetical protein
VRIFLLNFSDIDVRIGAGQKIGQLILEKISCPDIKVVKNLPETERGSNGFGSTDWQRSCTIPEPRRASPSHDEPEDFVTEFQFDLDHWMGNLEPESSAELLNDLYSLIQSRVDCLYETGVGIKKPTKRLVRILF